MLIWSGCLKCNFALVSNAAPQILDQDPLKYILTDRGSEFGDPKAHETRLEEIQRTNIYYCDPMNNGQIDGVENVHSMLRMVLPKETIFEHDSGCILKTSGIKSRTGIHFFNSATFTGSGYIQVPL